MPKIKSSKPAATTEVVVRGAADKFPLVPVADLGTPGEGRKNPWLRFYHQNSPIAANVRQALPNIQTGHAFISLPDESGVKYLAVTAIQLLQASMYFSDVQLIGAEMKLVRVRKEEPPRTDTKMSRDILAVLLAHTAEGVFPCVASFRKAAAPALQTLAQGIKEAGDWRAVVGVLTYATKMSKANGFNYTLVNCQVKPIDAKQVKEVAKLLSQEPCELLDAAAEGYEAKVAEYETLLAKG